MNDDCIEREHICDPSHDTLSKLDGCHNVTQYNKTDILSTFEEKNRFFCIKQDLTSFPMITNYFLKGNFYQMCMMNSFYFVYILLYFTHYLFFIFYTLSYLIIISE